MPFFLPLPPEAEGIEGKCAKLGLVCQQAGPGTTSAVAFLDWEVPGWPHARGPKTSGD